MCESSNQKRVRLESRDGDSVACRVAEKFWSRFVGLMGCRDLPPGEGLLIRPCNSIHMFFMRFSIDVAFLDRNFTIVRLVRGLAPGRAIGSVQGAWQVLEVTAGDMPDSFEEGTLLTVNPI